MFLKKKKRTIFAKTMRVGDISLIKLSAFAFALFLASLFPVLADPVLRWLWLLVALFSAIRPCYNFWLKK